MYDFRNVVVLDWDGDVFHGLGMVSSVVIMMERNKDSNTKRCPGRGADHETVQDEKDVSKWESSRVFVTAYCRELDGGPS